MSETEELARTVLLCRDYVAESVTDHEICRRLQSLRVLCVSDRRNLSCHAGQTALVTLVSLLSRMGMQVALEIPDVEFFLPQSPLVGSSLLNALLGVSEAFVRGATISTGNDSRSDVIFVLGDSPLGSHGSLCWRLTGTEWAGRIAFEGVGLSRSWTAEFPMGSMASAALAAAEAFKFVMRGLHLRGDFCREFLRAAPSSGWNFVWGEPLGTEFDLGPIDFISGGAISQAALYVLDRIPRIRMEGRIFDDDRTASSNLNRNALSLREDVGDAKVEVVARRCRQFRLEPIAARFGSGNLEVDRLAPRVVVGVDDIPSRWEVQRRGPAWVVVAGTSHFNVSSSTHRFGEPCSGCLHPVDEPGPNVIPTISFVSFWAGLTTVMRLLEEAAGRPCPRGRQHLWLSPLRMDLQKAAIWSPVPARRDCPVKCAASRSLTDIDPIGLVARS